MTTDDSGAHALKAPSDADVRHRIETDLDVNLFVEAAAGTGKTTALVSRMVALLRTGKAELREIVALTFTDKASGEMKLRLRERIEEERGRTDSAAERERLERATAQLELAQIATIHAFCADLLREWPIEAGVDPAFEQLAEDWLSTLDRAFDGWFEAVLSDPPDGVRRVLRWRQHRQDDESPRQRLRKAAKELVKHRDFGRAWSRPPFDREAEIDRLLKQARGLAELVDVAMHPQNHPAKAFRWIRDWRDELKENELEAPRDYDEIESTLRDLIRPKWRFEWLWKYKGRNVRDYAPGVTRQEALDARESFKTAIEAFLEAADADLAACLWWDLRSVIDRYEALKASEGQLDFLDLLIKARDLIRDNNAVRRMLQERYTRFFIDEYQDTDPLQTEILLLLVSNDPEVTDIEAVTPAPGKLFVVGDPKQAIYRFRRADVQLYQRVKRQLADRGTEVIRLSTSFRSVPGIQETVNAAFGFAMKETEDGSQAEYVPLNEYREPIDGQPGVVALPVPSPYKVNRWGHAELTSKAIDESFPDAVGAFIEWLIADSGWEITEPGRTEPVPVSSRHVCILTKRLRGQWGDPVRPYIEALENRQIRHVLIGGRRFFEREEVQALRAALTAIEWPDDTLLVYAVLKGPLFSLTDGQLLAWRKRMGSIHPLRPVPPDEELEPELQEVADALAVLANLHDRRNRQSVAETLRGLLSTVRAHAGFANWMNGEQALANCSRLIDRAREFEVGGAPSFRAFVDWLDDETGTGEAEEGPIVEEGTDGVRMMSVHKAKGLEFPVVILADPMFTFQFRDPSRYIEGSDLWAESLCGCVPADLRDNGHKEMAREEAEAVRLAYVAATRARDLLVLPSVGDTELSEIKKGWLDPLMPAVYPLRKGWTSAGIASGCPEFGDDSVFARPRDVSPPPVSVSPGLHASAAGSQIVWWDPACLDLNRDEQLGIRQRLILKVDESGKVAEAGFERHAAWQKSRADRVGQGTRPTRVARKMTAVAKDEVPSADVAEAAAGAEIVQVKRPEEKRPGGSRFGSLVHAALAVVPLDADADQIRHVVDGQARWLSATEEERAAAANLVAAALEHPVIRAAWQSGEGALRRELGVSRQRGDGQILEGVIDLAFKEPDADGWRIVDFKTDRDLSTEALSGYRRQLGEYALAVTEATGEPCSSTLLVL